MKNTTTNTLSRRNVLAGLGSAALIAPRFAGAAPSAGKPIRGIFIIMSTPYTEDGKVDFEDLAREVDFLDRSGVQGMVWPQMASEYVKLTPEERTRGMEVIAKAAKGKKPALVLGVQGPNTEAALGHVKHAEKLGADAMIAMPPTEAKTVDDFRAYYRALAKATKRPLFVQTTGGAKDVTPPDVDVLAELAREFPNCAYVKEEVPPVFVRMKAMAKQRPPIKGVFSGNAGRGLMYEMRLGLDGTMPGAPLADIYAQIWNLYQSGQQEKARDIFEKLLPMLECEQQMEGTRPYIMKKRGIFKTNYSRIKDVRLGPEEIREIDFHFESLKPYLKA